MRIRAHCVALLVANPELLNTSATTIERKTIVFDFRATSDDMPLPLPMPRTLLQEPGLLAEDLRQIAFREPDNYRHWRITADYMLRHCDSARPIMVLRTHRETYDGKALVFALLVFRPQGWKPMMPSVLFGEISLSPGLYDEFVREIGMYPPPAAGDEGAGPVRADARGGRRRAFGRAAQLRAPGGRR